MPIAILLPALLIGLLLGSFLNVCISRLPHHDSIVTPRSHCPHCKHPIRFYDNFPILSYLALRARCRDCRQPIPWRYPAVELATGLWFAYSFRNLDIATTHLLHAITLAIFGFLTIGLIVMDHETGLLPDSFTFTGIFLAMLLMCTQAIFLAPGEDQVLLHRKVNLNAAGAGRNLGNIFLTGPEALIFGRLAVIVGAALLLLAIRAAYKALRHQEGMGLGDVKMFAMVAAFLGWWPAILTLFLAVLSAATIGLLTLSRPHGLSPSEIHTTSTKSIRFGPFLGIAALIAAVFGHPIINWYSSFLR